MRNEIAGEIAVEVGYIFDDSVWGNGYAIEAARSCVDFAYQRFGINRLYATIRPENISSVRVAEKLGMMKVGDCVKIYRDIEMPHHVFMLEKKEEQEWP